MLTRKNEDYNDDEDYFIPDQSMIAELDKGLQIALNAASRILSGARKYDIDKDAITYWLNVTNLIRDAIDFSDDPDQYYELGKELRGLNID